VENNSLITSAKLSAQLFHCFNFFHNYGTKKDANITFFSLQTKSANRCFLSLCRSRVLTDGGHYGQQWKFYLYFLTFISILLVIIVALPDSVDYLCGGWVVTYMHKYVSCVLFQKTFLSQTLIRHLQFFKIQFLSSLHSLSVLFSRLFSLFLIALKLLLRDSHAHFRW